MTLGYLDMLNALLDAGAGQLGMAFRDAQVGFVAGRQCPDGGFPGRQGGADHYYTDFALRVLALLAPGHPAMTRATGFAGAPEAPHDVVDAFTRLHATRLLGRCGIPVTLDAAAYQGVLARFACPGGGYHGDDGRVSAYATFLAVLCGELLDLPVADPEHARAMADLHTPDGGYGDTSGAPAGQTSATAAALGVLLLGYAADSDDVRPALDFLAGMAAPDGGFRAHAGAPCGDLLSTFTAMTALSLLDGVDRVDLAAVARFLRACAAPGGGFRACPQDAAADCEYTYYGVGTLALLKSVLDSA